MCDLIFIYTLMVVLNLTCRDLCLLTEGAPQEKARGDVSNVSLAVHSQTNFFSQSHCSCCLIVHYPTCHKCISACGFVHDLVVDWSFLCVFRLQIA